MPLKIVFTFLCSACISVYYLVHQINGAKLSEVESVVSLIAVVAFFTTAFLIVEAKNKKDA